MNYPYVNLGFTGQDGENFRRNLVVKLEEVNDYRSKAGNEDFYRTIWRYPTQDYETAVEEGQTLAPLYFDIDNEDLEKAKSSALNLVNHLAERVPERHLRIYFSGNKGFHIEVPHQIFNLKENLPDEKAAYAYKNYAKHLKDNYAEDIDLAVYEPKRLWRAVNSKHSKTGLYKVPITLTELEMMRVEEIRQTAQNKRRDIYRHRQKPQPVREMEDIYREFREKEPKDSDVEVPEREGIDARKVEEPIVDRPTPCYKEMMEGAEEGERNETAIRLASIMRNMGADREEAFKKLREWNEKNEPPLPDHEIQNVVRSAYGNRYNYGCKDYLLKEYCDKKGCQIVSMIE